MTGQIRPVYVAAGVQTDALGTALARLGFTVEVFRTGSHQKYPCVVVSTGPERVAWATEYVYAGPNEAGQWWFWVSCSRQDPLDLEPVAPVVEVSVTADRLARKLTRARTLGV